MRSLKDKDKDKDKDLGRLLLVMGLTFIIFGIVKDIMLVHWIGCALVGFSAGLGWV